MSFILDALKKSESERQQQAGGEFSSVPSSSGDDKSYKWLWLLALLLGVNFAVLIGILMRPDTPPGPSPAVEAQPAAEPASEASFEELVAEARENQPEREEPVAAAPEPQPTVRTLPASAPPANTAYIPTIDEVRLDGLVQIVDLHLDIHVYSDNPAERFVFINMVKHREQSLLDEGPVVREITPDGVVLEHQGTTFLLPRE